MSITVSQIHNVLRTYDHLIKLKVDQTEEKDIKPDLNSEKVSVLLDQVTISEQSREHLIQDKAFSFLNQE
jgi:hypothetical protein